APPRALGGRSEAVLEVLPGRRNTLQASRRRRRLVSELLCRDDALALLAGDLGPVVGVGGVGEVFVFLELLADGGEEVVDHDALLAAADVALEGEFFGAADDGLDHGAGGEVLEVEDFLVAVGVGDFEEAIFLAEAFHGFDGGGDHGGDGGGGVAPAGRRLGEGDVGGEVLGEDVGGGGAIRALDLDLHVEAAGGEGSWGTMVVSTSEEMPVPRVRKRASISSKKTMTGTSSAAFSLALRKISRILRSVSPTYLLRSSGPLMLRKKPLIFSPRFSEIFSARLLATALAIMV